MGNIISYLKWRGDIGFLERPFCNVDNLVLAELSYFDFQELFLTMNILFWYQILQSKCAIGN